MTCTLDACLDCDDIYHGFCCRWSSLTIHASIFHHCLSLSGSRRGCRRSTRHRASGSVVYLMCCSQRISKVCFQSPSSTVSLAFRTNFIISPKPPKIFSVVQIVSASQPPLLLLSFPTSGFTQQGSHTDPLCIFPFIFNEYVLSKQLSISIRVPSVFRLV